MATKRRKKGKGTFLRYANENRRLKNKQRRMSRHIGRHPADVQAKARLKTLPEHRTGHKAA